MKDDAPVTQIVQLTGQAGNYDYYAPVMTCTDTTIRNKIIPVGHIPSYAERPDSRPRQSLQISEDLDHQQLQGLVARAAGGHD
jgi:hypothetical protein